MAIYRQSFESLVQRLMLPENILDEIWNKASSPAWKDQELAERLRDQFGSSAEYAAYTLAVTRLHNRVNKLRSKLEIDENFQPAWMSSSATGPNSLNKFFSKSQKFRRAVKIGFNNGRYLQLANDIEADVNQIKTLTEGARTLEHIRAERYAKDAAKNPSRGVQQTRSSYSSASDSTPIPIPTIITTHHVGPSLPQTSNTNPTRTQIGLSSISNLCDALLRATHQVPSLGFLQDQEWHHHFYTVRPWQELDTRNQLASLDKVLTSSGSMGTKTKFKLAATLVSAVLQFHATPWLDDKWDLREIYFLGDTTTTTTTTTPTARNQVPTTRNDSHQPRQQDPSVSNEILFALGVALLELSYGKPLLSYQQPDDLDDTGEAHVLTKPLIAKRLLHDLGDREPSKYVDVVDRCIRCRFDTTSTSLEDPMFLALFCQGVVMPLREICDIVA
ncbi:hypothetical protein B0H66DRAFT_630425 [Apodospora peruviana]|uniref:DUF7580 domain-containing protein n=1 Tax=Apodospora peruviana TaxID=516989 RepID=A0AAE0M065_9PEZI|nr:hypothetical protein B0H66DRAFT_630425 [Apodospora peruviana]